MQVWKLEACQTDDRQCCRWGYALADDADGALHLGRTTTDWPLVWVHELHPDKIWPGPVGKTVYWSS